MFPKGTVTAAVTPAEKQPVTAQKESTVVYMVDKTDSEADAVNASYWHTQRVRICACAVVLTTLILVAGTLGGIVIVLTHTNGVATTDPTLSLNHDREPLFSNEVPLPKLPEPTIRIIIDNGGLIPPTEPVTPDLIAIDDGTELVVSGDDQEGDYGSAESDLEMTDGPSATGPEGVFIASSSSDSNNGSRDSSSNNNSSSSSSSSSSSGDSSSSSYEETYYVSE